MKKSKVFRSLNLFLFAVVFDTCVEAKEVDKVARISLYMPTIAGKELSSLEETKVKITYIDFGEFWCAPCKES